MTAPFQGMNESAAIAGRGANQILIIMNSKKINQIANWLLDRVAAGQSEEIGSMDWADFGRTHTIIMKSETGFDVWLNDCPFPDFSLTEQSTPSDIKKEIARA